MSAVEAVAVAQLDAAVDDGMDDEAAGERLVAVGRISQLSLVKAA